MQDKLKESISKSEHLTELFTKSGSCNFSHVGTNPKEFFSQEDIDSNELGTFHKEFISA